MSITKMKMVKVYGKKERLKDFVAACCTDGNFHAEEAGEYASLLQGLTPYDEENPYAESIAKTEEFAALAGITLEQAFGDLNSRVDLAEEVYIDGILEEIHRLTDEKAEIEKRLEDCREAAAQMKHFSGCSIPIDDIIASKFLKIRMGKMPLDCYERLPAYENENMYFVKSEEENGFVWGTYIAPTKIIDRIDRIFSGLFFERVKPVETQGTPDEILAKIDVRTKELKEKRDDINRRIAEFAQQQSQNCIDVYNHIKFESGVCELCKKAVFYETNEGTYFAYVGWIPSKQLKKFDKEVGEIESLYYESFEPEGEYSKKAPVKLNNRGVFKPFEMFVSMYGLPWYSSMDITAFVAITYILLFGIMFADMGQGFVLAVGAFLLYKFKKVQLAGIMIPCGCASMIFGFVFGSVFGYEELLDPVYHALGMKGKPISAMEEINTVLLIAIGIGVALVIVSMLMNVVMSLKEKKIGKAIFDSNGLVGIVFYTAGVCAVYSFMGGGTILPTGVIIAIAAIALPLLLIREILIGAIDKKKNFMPESFGDFFAQNFFELIECILSYFSNTVSFLRVGAFVLVHAGMMQVFFSLTSDPTSPIGILIIALGNVVVMCLEGLLTGIQVLRLEFYEMFSRFFEGDGRPFIAVNLRNQKVK